MDCDEDREALGTYRQREWIGLWQITHNMQKMSKSSFLTVRDVCVQGTRVSSCCYNCVWIQTAIKMQSTMW